MAANSFLNLFLLQLICVAAVSVILRRGIPIRLNVLLSSAFVTVPVWSYAPLADVGMLFLFDLVVPAMLLSRVIANGIVIRAQSGATVVIGSLIFFLPLLYAPIGYLFLDPTYIAYHTLNLAILLYRSMLILVAVVFLFRDLKFSGHSAVTKLMASQCLLLFSFGALQYLAGLDLVVYERLKDVENVVDVMLSGEEKILFGFGFLGLFRGAVSQMAVIGIFWWLLASMARNSGKVEGYALMTMLVLAAVCVVGSLSRIGAIAIIGMLLYGVYIHKRLRSWSVAFLIIGLPVLVLSPYLDAIQGVGTEMVFGRFDLEQISGQAGSGGTRVESAMRLFDDLQTSWFPWIVGLGGFNPISASEHYGVFGMHGDYLDLIARYGLLVGIAYIGMVIFLFFRLLGGFYSPIFDRRQLPRAFGALGIGISILALTQGALTFSGSAGYLACAQSWVAIAFCIATNGKMTVQQRKSERNLAG